jgi:TetR/AcrR family transcriptional repressor of nem operon
MRGRPREFDRDEVLDKAMETFWETGYDGTPIKDLVERLGIGRQSLYLAFGGKRQLFEEALARYGESVILPLIEQLNAPGSPRGNVEKVLDHWQRISSSPDFKGCLVGQSAAEFADRDAVVATRLRKGLELLERSFTDALRRAQKEGEISPEKNPRKVARAIVAAVQGVAIWGPVRRSPAFVRDAFDGIRDLLD